MALLSAVGVPLRLLHEAEGHPVTVELKSGDLYRGHLLAAEDSMSVQLSAVVHTARDGRVTKCVVAAGGGGWRRWLRGGGGDGSHHP